MLGNIFAFIMGAVIGSFLNVCIYRIPKGKSVVFPPSSCPKCNKYIRWYDNIPILSYLLLRGRCRHCKSGINLRYIIVELITAFLALALYVAFKEQPVKLFSYFFLSAGLIIATFVDFEIQEIPDEISVGGLVAGLVTAFLFPELFDVSSRWLAFSQSAIGAIVGGGSIYLMGFLGELVFKKEAMGGGDVKLMAMIGALLGWKLVLFIFFIAPIFGAIVGVVLRIKDGREIIPYGPYISLAALIAVFFGNMIIDSLFFGPF